MHKMSVFGTTEAYLMSAECRTCVLHSYYTSHIGRALCLTGVIVEGNVVPKNMYSHHNLDYTNNRASQQYCTPSFLGFHIDGYFVQTTHFNQM